jgi:hypothetical protein
LKLIGDFKNFLSDTVNLNQTRIDRLEERVATIKDFIRGSDWEPQISTFIEQGSWAHDTIIRPVDGGEFDADLLVKVYAVDGWSAAQYVKELGRVFLDSGRYSDKTVVYDYCVTITYADDCKIDIAPLVMDREYQGSFTHEETVGYYNNDQTNPIKRLAASVMESAFFTSEITRLMLPATRAKTFGYILIYIVAVLNRSSDLAFLAVAAQALFGGEVVARWLRLEWLRLRSERAFNNFNRLFAGRVAFTKAIAQSEALDLFSFYESTKSTAAMLLSQKLFDRYNPRLTQEWEKIRGTLGI